MNRWNWLAPLTTGLLLVACSGGGDETPHIQPAGRAAQASGRAGVIADQASAGFSQAAADATMRSQARQDSSLLRARALAVPAATAPRGSITAGALMDWAETAYRVYFPNHEADRALSPYVYRYYAATENYLGVAGEEVYVLGRLTDNQLVRVGRLQDFACQVQPSLCAPVTPTTSHPRLWITEGDLPRLRGWATAANPLYQQGLLVLANRAKADMDRGALAGDCGTREYEEYPTEMYAELFAFMSLIEPEAASRSDYAARARALLMTVMNQAVLGPASARNHACGWPPFRDPEFFGTDSNRARWHGEAFALTVDWIYPSLSAQDKQTIRTVFLRWSQEIIDTGYHHPEPVGLLADAALLTTAQVRWSGNNYFTAHMRNLGLMALSLDTADDAGNQLRGHLANATGAWLYIFDRLTRTDSLGGLLPEGFEYSPQTASYATQLLLALRTAGVDDCGTHCRLDANVFWDDFVSAYLHSLSPTTVNLEDDGGTGYLPASYGDAQSYRTPDFIDAFGAIALFDRLAGNTTRLNTLRWAQRHTAPGGGSTFMRRLSNAEDFRQALLYFMLYDPAAAAANDPRPAMPLLHFAPGLNKILVRTGWDSQASWFTFTLGWNAIDHQTADGANFEWYRKGEWLTKARSGYPDIAEGIGSSEFYNTLGLQNDAPKRDASDWRTDLWQRGSQWNLVASGAPSLLARSDDAGYSYALGDATQLYNSSSEGVTDIQHASRSIVWLKADDAIVVYDRAQSNTANRFKRWWLQLANPATVNGRQATATTPGGQRLTVSNLLPSAAVLSAIGSPGEPIESQVAAGEPMKVRLRIEASGNPASVRSPGSSS